jgi:anti-anti-sigma factor
MNELATIRREGDEDVIVVRVAGEIDMSNAANVADEIMTQVSNEAVGLVVDLTDVSYLDSAGIRMLMELAKRLGWRGQILRIVAPSGSRSRHVLSITSADTLLVFAGSREEATASLLIADDPS